jgi:hypothetical protein
MTAGVDARSLTFTFYEDIYNSTGGVPHSLPWDRWLEGFTQHSVRGSPTDSDNKEALEAAKIGPAIVLADIPQGQPRKIASVVAVHGMSLDIEDVTDDEIKKVLQGPLAPYEWVAHTTHKHGARCLGGGTRLRVILPLATPVMPTKFREAWHGLNTLAGGINDPATKDASRALYLPSTFDPSIAWAYRHPGRWLSPDEIVASGQAAELSGRADEEAARSMRRRMKRIENEDPVKELAKAVLEGSPLSESGGRHDAIRDLTWWMAQRDDTLTDAVLEVLCGASIRAMQSADPTSPGMADVITCYHGAVTRIKETAETAARQRQLQEALPGQAPYTEADLARIAEAQGWQPAELRRRWIIQKDTTFYLLDRAGAYRGPFAQSEARINALDYFACAPVTLFEPTENGYRRRNIMEIAEDHGSGAAEIVADLTAQYSRFDATTATFWEAIRPRRKLEPVFDQRIDDWLRVLAGVQYPKLCDWFACVPDLSKLLCALYLAGHPGAGKTLLAHGLARIWHEGPPAELDRILSDFNEDLCQCPLVLGDEALPKMWKGTPITTKLRSVISTTSRALSRKYRAPATMQGAIRLVLTANNEFLLDSREVSSSQDLDAVAQRFLYIDVPATAATILDPQVTDKEWIEGDGIAKHALYLMEHRTVTRGRRFWVEGEKSEMHLLLTTGSLWNSLCCEWLVRYLCSPQSYDSRGDGLVYRGGGGLWVNDQAVLDGWNLYLGNTKREPETAKVGAALRALSTKNIKQIRTERGRRVRLREINVPTLLAWSEHFNIGDKETILEAVGADDREPGSDDVALDINTRPTINAQPC